MLKRLALGLPLVFVVACSNSSNDNHDSSPGGGDVASMSDCKGKIAPTQIGREISVDQLASGKSTIWKLSYASFFQSLEGSDKSLYVAAQALKSGDDLQVTRICGGGTSGTSGTFEMRFPETLRGSDGSISSNIKFSLEVDSSSILSKGISSSIGGGKLSFSDLPSGSKTKITMITDSSLELWVSFPAPGTGKGDFVYRATYTSMPAPPPNSLEVFQQAYEFAYSSQGLDLNASSARSWASAVSARGADAGAAYLKTFKTAYGFLYSSQGVDLNRQSAMSWADAIAAHSNPDQTFQTFKKAYEYAYGSSGLDLNRNAALKFASEQANVTPPAS